jgi:hypothetical protein
VLDRREFNVQLVVTSTHEYVVTARSEEEAVSIAEGLFEDEDEGEITSSEVETADAYPMDEEDLEDDEEE